jgi:hypothetical protein
MLKHMLFTNKKRLASCGREETCSPTYIACNNHPEILLSAFSLQRQYYQGIRGLEEDQAPHVLNCNSGVELLCP